MNEPFPGYENVDVLNGWLRHHENVCGHVGAMFVGPLANPMHFARLECLVCGAKTGFLPRPRSKQEQKTRRPRLPIVRLDEDRCHVCGANRMEAQILGRTLEPHHLIDRARLVDAGYPPDDPKYIAWICSQGCHPIVTALRQATGTALTMAGAFGANPE